VRGPARRTAWGHARAPVTLTAVGSVSLALTAVLFSGTPSAHPANVAHGRTAPPSPRTVPVAPNTSPTPTVTPTPTASPTPSASPTPTASPVLPTVTPPATRSGDSRSEPTDGFVTPTCEVRSVYRIKTHHKRSLWVPGTHFVDGPGGEMEAAVEKEHEVMANVLLEKEVRLNFDFRSFFAEARKMVSPVIQKRNRVLVGHKYKHLIRNGMYGHMRYRVFGYRIGFWQYRQFGNCGIRFIGSGVANIPTNKQGWKYWETRSP
jgi:hypothetical protein